MVPTTSCHVFLCVLALLGLASTASIYYQYIVVGAGPAGLQLGYFLKRANRDYVILERSNVSGNFFTIYPRHDKLISINKRHTGKTNKEFNFRHDWNSLISDDESLQLRHYTKEFFPHRKTLVRYLNDYERKLGINVQHNTDVSNIQRVVNASAPGSHSFTMQDQHGNTYICNTLVMATGMWKNNKPNFKGVEHTISYEDVSTNPDDYEGKTVLILGRGNTAFEVAQSIYGATNLVHMVARSRVRLSWATHYVGDLRAVNNELLDTYQLKSLDGVLETEVEDMKVIKKGDKLYVGFSDSDGNDSDAFDNFAMREAYDAIIRCLGWQFDDSAFNITLRPSRGKGRLNKYARIYDNYESVNMPGLFFAGTAAHSVDHRKSAGGFIHGFRYTARALHRLLEWRNHKAVWPSVTFPFTELLNHIIKRINEASGLYQMFSVLSDVMVLRNEDTEIEYFEEFPLNLIHEFSNVAGKSADKVIVLSMEYGANFSGPGNDIFRLDRATGEPSEAFRSNFLHPVFYFYNHLPTADQMKGRSKYEALPRPDKMHHIVEDFLTAWDAPTSHILPLRRFLESCKAQDLRTYFAEDCFKLALTNQKAPLTCEGHYLQGEGLLGTEDLLLQASQSGLLL